MKNFLHLAIALMSVVMPALAVTFNCSGYKIDESVVAREMKKRIRQNDLSQSTLGSHSTTFYKYFDITTSGLTSSSSTGFRCYTNTGTNSPDVREWDGVSWTPCSQE
ncbi:unnamed protein product [Blumeria hordei]|uniref:Uncharacterized protein n=1 Tax=Blumeria hordei TaxID=2867405 RepID=A0A383UJ61_BLUHO|nr:unnamed protein product [Blumeria hordei]